jgi:rSAM/selenodomain-associated transferase 2
MRVSVVIPVLDEARALPARLAELGALGVHEIVVADGGSQDGTIELLMRHPEVRLVYARRGRALQMNAGAAAATGDVLLFLHADVALPSDALAQIERALAEPRVVLGAFRTWTIADRPSHLAPLLHLADLRSRYSSLPYGDQAMFLRTVDFHAVGGFPAIPLMEDLALSRRLRARGRVRVVPARVRVSGRRFLERPVFYTTLVNVYPALYRLGVPPSLLARFYRAVR